MARKPLRPLIRSGGFYPSRKWTPLVYAGGYTTANGGEEPAPPPIEKTITGNPIHILDALAKPAQALSVKLEPVQDLNGYSYPWPAGGGANQWDEIWEAGGINDSTGKNMSASGTWRTVNYIPVVGGNSYYLYAEGSGNIRIYKYAEDKSYIGYISVPIKSSFTLDSSVFYLRFRTVIDPSTHNFAINYPSTITTYSPYSNICPITGHDNVTLKQSNRNIWAFNSSFSPSGYAVLVPRNTEFYLPAGTYTFSAIPDIESSSVVLGGYYADDTQVTLARLSASEERQSETFTIAKPLYKMYLIANKGGTISDIQLEVGDTDTGYEAASISTINVSLVSGDNTSTVYGGTLDVVTGELTVTHAEKIFVGADSESWARDPGNSNLNRYRIGINGKQQTKRWPVACNEGVYPDSYSVNDVGTVFVSAERLFFYPLPSINTVSLFKAWLADNPLQVVYELAEPVTYQLTPTEVTLLLGENNIWSDGEMTLTYLADGDASDEEALNILLGGRYVNNHSEDEPTDREALDVLLGGNTR